jgi:hypothetical protein
MAKCSTNTLAKMPEFEISMEFYFFIPIELHILSVKTAI